MQWEAEYQKFILEFAVLAEEVGAEILCIGTEYKIAATSRPEFWRKLIAEVRKVYRGKLTYSANWDEYGEILFWEDLDYIGISGYFPLSETKVPTLMELSAAWLPVKSLLRALSLKSDIPILFTEFGYRSVEKAAGKHWTLDDAPLNTEAQRIAFQSFFDNLWQEPWVSGGFVWKWELRPEAGGLSDRKYTPQSKPAQAVIANAFAQ